MHLLLGSSVRALTSDCCFCLFSPNLREDHSAVVLWVVLVFGPLLEQAAYSLTPSQLSLPLAYRQLPRSLRLAEQWSLVSVGFLT